MIFDSMANPFSLPEVESAIIAAEENYKPRSSLNGIISDFNWTLEALASAGTENSHGKDNFTQVSCTINMKLDAGCINKVQGIKKDIQR